MYFINNNEKLFNKIHANVKQKKNMLCEFYEMYQKKYEKNILSEENDILPNNELSDYIEENKHLKNFMLYKKKKIICDKQCKIN
jgi:hypothetical protein